MRVRESASGRLQRSYFHRPEGRWGGQGQGSGCGAERREQVLDRLGKVGANRVAERLDVGVRERRVQYMAPGKPGHSAQ